MWRRIESVMVAHLATVGRGGRPHIVPITFAAGDGVLYSAIDQKPKKTVHLQRLRNIEANPEVSVLFDQYEEDWTKLWWVRIDGRARILSEGAEFENGLELLVKRYAQYRSAHPPGPVMAVEVDRMSAWSAS